jgi:UDPglucose 6-dehydrogenase
LDILHKRKCFPNPAPSCYFAPMKITVFGIGYVGLVTGACLADIGHEVLCVDIDQKRVDNLKKGIIPIYEPGLTPLVQRNFEAGRLKFTTNIPEAVDFGLLQFIAVGTPPDDDGSADLQYVLSVAKSIGQNMDEYKVVIDKSTVPVGTADLVTKTIQGELDTRNASFAFDVCSNPEFLKEGAAINDFTQGARIVIGTESERVKKLMRECYGPYNRNHEKIIFMDVRSAELTKYAANAMLATKISFMNEIANLAELLGADIEAVRHGIGSDPRIGYHFIYAGCGYGGSCFPKDVKALAQTASKNGYESKILNAVEEVNETQKGMLFKKLKQAFGGDVAGKTIAVWGLAFKPNTNDMREAPARNLMESLWAAGAKVQAYDPEAMEECHRIYSDRKDLVMAKSANQALENADALVICTEWKEFRTANFDLFKKHLKQPIIVDGRNLYDPAVVKEAGFKYYAIGRGDSIQRT